MDSALQRDGLVILARYPRPGQVKTRLAAAVGARAAADLYRAFLADLDRRLACDPRWRSFWAFDPPGEPFSEIVGSGAEVFPQACGDLGQRMAVALGEVFRRGVQRAVLIGSDVPHVAPGRIAEAFSRLTSEASVVLGPATDGGYYLIGARGAVPAIFDGVPWGSEEVLSRTLAAARAAGWRAELLPEEYDVDEEADLRRLAADPVLAELSATRAVIAGIV